MDARIYDRSGGGFPLANTASGSAAIGLGTFLLVDNRDNKDYLVRRLADGNCWMVQNLNLDLNSFVGTNNLNNNNTDLNSKAVWNPGKSAHDIAETISQVTWSQESYFPVFAQNRLGNAQKYQFQPANIIGEINGIEYYWTSKCSSPGVCDATTDNKILARVPRSYHYEERDTYLYNYYSASAEYASSGIVGQDIVDSICPLGWMIPFAVNKSSYENLISDVYRKGRYDFKFNIAADLPFSFTTAGYYRRTEANVGGNTENTFMNWTSTISDQNSDSTYALIVNASQAYFGKDDTYAQGHGLSIRCVNRDSVTEGANPVISSCPAGKICYSGNGGTGGMGNQSVPSPETEGDDVDVVLTASTFTRLGYGFAGWNTQANGFGTTYGPNETITITDGQLASEGLQLYAKWIPSTGTMQDFTTAQCTALGIHQSIALTDNRDGNTYTVTKLKDNNCWMTQNLALNLADFAGTKLLTPANTDLPSKEGVPAAQQYWDPAESTVTKYTTTYKSALESRNLTKDFTGLSTLLLGQAQPAQFQSANQTGYTWGSIYEDDNGVPSTSQTPNNSGEDAIINGVAVKVRNNANSEMPRSYHQRNDGNGDYYNWYAATAESGKYDTSAMGTVVASDSICPKGWKLPSAPDSSSDSWSHLFGTVYGITEGENAESSKALRKAPFNISLPAVYNHVAGNTTALYHGFYFTSYDTNASMVSTNVGQYSFVVNRSLTSYAGNYHKIAGHSVRCVKK